MSDRSHHENKATLLPRLLSLALLLALLVVPLSVLHDLLPLETSASLQAESLAGLDRTVLTLRFLAIGGLALLLLLQAFLAAWSYHDMEKDAVSADPEQLNSALRTLPGLAREQVVRHVLLLALAAATMVNLLQTPPHEHSLLLAGLCLLGLTLLLLLRAALYPLEALLVKAVEVLRRNLSGHGGYRRADGDNREIRVTLPQHRSALPGLLTTALVLCLLAGGALYLDPLLLQKLLTA